MTGSSRVHHPCLGDTQGCAVPIPVPAESLQHGHPECGSAGRRHERRCALGRAHRHLPGTHHLRGQRWLRGPGQGAGEGTVSLGCPGGWDWAWGRGALPTPNPSLVSTGPRGGLARRGRMAGPWWLHAGHQAVSAALGRGTQGRSVPTIHTPPSAPLPHHRTLPKTCMEKIVENVRKFNIQGLLVIGGFEVRQNSWFRGLGWLWASQRNLSGMWIWLQGQHFPVPRLLAGVRGGAAAGGGTWAVRGALHCHVRHPRHHQQQCARHRLQPGLRHGRQCCHGGEGHGQGQLTGPLCSTTFHHGPE